MVTNTNYFLSTCHRHALSSYDQIDSLSQDLECKVLSGETRVVCEDLKSLNGLQNVPGELMGPRVAFEDLK